MKYLILSDKMLAAKKSDILWIDFLRVIATVSVIVVHINADIVLDLHGNSSFVWETSNLQISWITFSP